MISPTFTDSRKRQVLIPFSLALLFPVLILAATSLTVAAKEPFGPSNSERAGEDWWSLRKVQRPQLPAVKNPAWVRNPIDQFVLAKLEERGLHPGPDAEAGILNRRIHLGLTGLPPDPGKPDSHEATVKKLLASPHFGERWARHWLDVARFGESNGFEYDALRSNAWCYRDWVIKALNEDMPYDRFVRLQIAGDVLEPQNPDAITATSFLVCGAFDGLVPQGDKQRKIMRQDEMEDIVGTVSQSFLGLTVHCARCHDHKFDPIRQTEYYQLSSALSGVRRGDRDVPAGGDPAGLTKRRNEIADKLTKLEAGARKAALAGKQKQSKENPGAMPPRPIARWTFETDLKDDIGTMHGTAKGGARVEGGALHLDGKAAYVATAPLQSKIRAKTLEAWVKLSNLDQRGGGVISLQGMDGQQFDAIVFGEREPKRWMAGSNGFSRTKGFQGGEEREAVGQFVHVAIVYQEDGTITGYRNGIPYGKAYNPGGVATFDAGRNQVMFGMRHGSSAGKGRMLAGAVDRAQLYDRALTAEEVAASAKVPIVTDKELVAQLDPAEQKSRDEWKKEIARLDSELQKIKKRKVFTVKASGSKVVHLLKRGSPFEPGEVVSPGGLAAVEGLEGSFGLAPNAPEADRRKKLAAWITNPENPLFARVMMNRLWHYHFGQGLVKTPNDLGFSGGTPSHPELLDWLAAEFKAQGWSMKKMHELLVNSATYRQSSRSNKEAAKADSGNVYLWRYNPRRLEAEVIRDSILKVSGALNPKMGGPGFRDFKMYNHKGSWVYDPLDPDGAEFNRRSIYRTWARGSIHPLLNSFDCPDPSATTPVRSVTTTPLGALSLMNTSFVLRMSDIFAVRAKEEAGAEDVAKQVTRAYEIAFGRQPKAAELAASVEFVKRNGLPAFCRVIFNATEFVYVN